MCLSLPFAIQSQGIPLYRFQGCMAAACRAAERGSACRAAERGFACRAAERSYCFSTACAHSSRCRKELDSLPDPCGSRSHPNQKPQSQLPSVFFQSLRKSWEFPSVKETCCFLSSCTSHICVFVSPNLGLVFSSNPLLEDCSRGGGG